MTRSASRETAFRTARRLLLALLAGFGAAAAAQAQPTLSIEDHYRLRVPSGLAISPDGRTIAYGVAQVDRADGSTVDETRLIGADGRGDRRLCTCHSISWSPDGRRIAFIADRSDGSEGLFVQTLAGPGAGAPAREVGAGLVSPQYPQWSPDGRTLAVFGFVAGPPPLAIAPTPGSAAALPANAPDVTDRLHFRAEGQGTLPLGHDHLFLVDTASGSARQLTSGAWSVGARETGEIGAMTRGAAWSPDGRTILIDGLFAADSDLRRMESNIHAVDVGTGRVTILIGQTPPADPRAQDVERQFWAEPAVSPDGRWVAYVGATWRYPNAHRPLGLWIARPDGSGARRIDTGAEDPVGSPVWSADSRRVYFALTQGGHRHLMSATPEGRVARLTQGDDWAVSASAVSPTGKAVAEVTGTLAPGELFAIDLAASGRPRTRLTDLNPWLAGLRRESIEFRPYQAPGLGTLGAWVIKPPGFDPARRYPAIFFVAGGPYYAHSGLFGSDWTLNLIIRALAAQGYVVYTSNYAGNTGYGRAVVDALPAGWGGQALAGAVDESLARLKALPYVDPARVHLVGESAGGYVAAWWATRTRAFRSISALWPIVNWVSQGGTSDEAAYFAAPWARPYWEDAEPFLRASPLFEVEKVTSPVLLMTGENDFRTPIGQAEEFFRGLKQVNRAPTVLIRLRNEGHAVSGPNVEIAYRYILEWIRKWDRP